MSISEHFWYRNDVFQSDIFVSDIGITDVDVGCRISPKLRSMSMPTYVTLAHTRSICMQQHRVLGQEYIFNPRQGKTLLVHPQIWIVNMNTHSQGLAKDIRQLKLGQVYSVIKLAWDSKKLVYSGVAPSNGARFIQQICPLSRQFCTFLKKCGPLFLLARVSWLFFLNGNCSLLAEV
jgi:hypothetical protein